MIQWVARIVAIVILLLFVVLMMNLQSKLTKLQRERPVPASSTTSTTPSP